MSARPHAADAHGRMYYLGPTLLIFATFMTFRHREMADLFETGTDPEIKVKLAIWAILGLIALQRLPAILRNSPLLFTLPLAPYAVFCSLALFSTLYSMQPSLSAVRAGQLLVVIALALSMRDRAPEWTKLGAIYLGINWAFLLIGITGLIPALNWRNLPGFQEIGYDGFFMPWRFGTPAGHFSIISLVAAMLLVAQAARLQRRPALGDVGYFLWLSVTLLLTVSRTGIIGAVLGLGVVLLLRGFVPIVLLLVTAASSVLLLIPGLIEAILSFLARGQDVEDLESLTGRTGIYESALAIIDQHWLFGVGFRASRAAHINEIEDSAGNVFGTAAHAHNAVLESTASLGVVGTICALAILFSFLACGIGLLRRAGRPRSAWRGRIAPHEHQSAGFSAWSRATEFCAYWPPIFAFSMLDSSFALEINPFVFCFVAVLLDFTAYRAGLLEPRTPHAFHALPLGREHEA